jgi:hypothetical protein
MHSHSNQPYRGTMQDGEIESCILRDLAESGPYSIDQLRERLAGCTWQQVFDAVCRLSRSGRLYLRQSLSFGYSVSLNFKARTTSRESAHWAREGKGNSFAVRGPRFKGTRKAKTRR